MASPSYGASGSTGGGAEASPDEGGTKVAVLRSQVNEVKEVMSDNIEKVMQRGENLDNLVTKTTDLEAGAAVFRDKTKIVRRKMWWKNTKMNIIIGVVVVVIILIIIVSTVDWSSSSPPAPPTTTDKPA